MTRRDDDPFERLSRMALPEPHPAKIEAAVTASARAFSERLEHSQTELGGVRSRFSSWFSGTRWAVPASAAGFALVALIAIVPLVNHPAPPSTDPAHSPAREALARAEPRPAPMQAPQPMEEEAPRMGAVPPPAQQSPLDMGEDTTFERFTFGDLELGLRTAPEQVAMYVLEGNVERQFDLRVKEPSQAITISDGFIYEPPAGGARVLLVRSGYSDTGQNWEAFVETARGYSLSGALTLRVNDAQSREEVVARLRDNT